MVMSKKAVDEDFLVDPLKRAQYELTQRKIRREDLSMAIAERQVVTEEEHREKVASLISMIVTMIDTYPDQLERRGLIRGEEVSRWRELVDKFRDDLFDWITEFELTRINEAVKVAPGQIDPKTQEGMTVGQKGRAAKRGGARPTTYAKAKAMGVT